MVHLRMVLKYFHFAQFISAVQSSEGAALDKVVELVAEVVSHAFGKAGERPNEEGVGHKVGIVHIPIFDLKLDSVRALLTLSLYFLIGVNY